MNPSKQQAIIAWTIWFATLQTAFIIPFFIGDGFPSGKNSDVPMGFGFWALCLGPILFASFIRWIILPKLREPPQRLVAMIIGLALSEAAILFSTFSMVDYPQYQVAVLMIAVISLIQFAPTYATPGLKVTTKETSAA